jgi:hypothetical protein
MQKVKTALHEIREMSHLGNKLYRSRLLAFLGVVLLEQS